MHFVRFIDYLIVLNQTNYTPEGFQTKGTEPKTLQNASFIDILDLIPDDASYLDDLS